MKKMILSVFLAGLLIIFGSAIALASSPVLLDGEFVDVETVAADGRTLLPIRALAETLGGDVDWNPATRQATVVQGNTTIVLTIGSTTALVNGSAVTLDVPARTIDGRTFLPLRFVGESLGLEIDFYAQTVIVSTSANTLSESALREIARTATAARAAATPTPQPPAVQPQPAPREGQNALRAGRDYLRIMPFSHRSLTSQLEFEGFPADAIGWAMAQIDRETNWREQAVRSARAYIEIMSFSRSGLIDQLIFEGFSREDATYAADRVI